MMDTATRMKQAGRIDSPKQPHENPAGVSQQSEGLRVSAQPWKRRKNNSQPRRGCLFYGQPMRQMGNPFRVVGFYFHLVQGRADTRNPSLCWETPPGFYLGEPAP